MQTHFSPEQLRDPETARSNEILRSCVHCGFCTATCPTYQVLGDELDGPRGRIYLIKQVLEGATGSKSSVVCDALLVDTISRSDTYPYVDVREDDVQMGHEATVSKVSEDQLFYLRSRGLSEEEAMAMIVRGFVEPIARELPMEYALELNRLIELQMEGAVG